MRDLESAYRDHPPHTAVFAGSVYSPRQARGIPRCVDRSALTSQGVRAWSTTWCAKTVLSRTAIRTEPRFLRARNRPVALDLGVVTVSVQALMPAGYPTGWPDWRRRDWIAEINQISLFGRRLYAKHQSTTDFRRSFEQGYDNE